LRSGLQWPAVTKSVYADQAAAEIKASRFRMPSVAAIAAMLRDELDWESLSSQAVYY